MKRHPTRDWKSWIIENGSYKLVALFVTLILWVTILGRRDFQLTKEMNVEFLLPEATVIASEDAPKKVKVKVTGPRVALKRFQLSPGMITIDLTRSQAGMASAVITPRHVEVPFGVKVVGVTPEVVEVRLVKAKDAAGNLNGPGSKSGP